MNGESNVGSSELKRKKEDAGVEISKSRSGLQSIQD
jgi:hypothetical protein